MWRASRRLKTARESPGSQQVARTVRRPAPALRNMLNSVSPFAHRYARAARSGSGCTWPLLRYLITSLRCRRVVCLSQTCSADRLSAYVVVLGAENCGLFLTSTVPGSTQGDSTCAPSWPTPGSKCRGRGSLFTARPCWAPNIQQGRSKGAAFRRREPVSPRAAATSDAIVGPYAAELLPGAAVDSLADDVRVPRMPGSPLDVADGSAGSWRRRG